MSEKWTAAQREAIEARGGNLLVSAAAGSGKTAVLAARIAALVTEGARVDDLLVVTFTKAAAAEMRARILTRLHEIADMAGPRAEWMAQQALRVERADICTLHSFCGQVCREHFQAAGVDPTFRVADAAEAGVLHAEALVEALTACYEAPTPAFAHAAACLSQAELGAAVEALHAFLMARPDPWEWLEGTIALHEMEPAALKESTWMRVLLGKIAADAEAAVDAYARALDYAKGIGLYQDFAEAERCYALDFLVAAQNGYDACMSFYSEKPGNKPRKPKGTDEAQEEHYKKLRADASALLKQAVEASVALSDLPRRAEDLQGAGLMLRGVAEAARAFHDRYAERKAEKNLLDFHDLEHFALRALDAADVSQALQARYSYVFIDEYQDSSQLQEAILDQVCRGNNLFMVGDVKQSIYRFRLAEPGLFLRKLRTFGTWQGDVDRKIALNANFRSHPMLLDGVNAVFQRVFRGDAMELEYPPEDWLIAGREADWTGAPVELHLIEGAEAEDDATDEDELLTPQSRAAICQEAEVIADRILALRDAPEGGYRPRDCAVLMRTVRGKAAQVVETLRSRGIPAWSDLGEDTLQRPEVQDVVALLRTVDNLRQDVPLLAALRGPALGLTDESLAQIRVARPEGSFADAMLAYAERGDALAGALSGFIAQVRGWAMDANALPLDTLLRGLYEETSLYATVGALPDGASRQANLRALAEHAGAYQRAQFGGLGGFLRYLDRIKARDGLAAVELGEADDVVRVLSIHKSKGLQFPVVFVAGLGSRYGKAESRDALQLHAELGAALPTINPVLRTKWSTVAQDAIAEKRRQEALAEEARVLYVAMTRAEKRMILIGTPRKGDRERWDREALPSATCALDWLVPCAQGEEGWHIDTHAPRVGLDAPVREEALASLVEDVRAIIPDSAGRVARALGWRMPARSLRALKQSVTAVTRAAPKPGEEPDAPLSLESMPKRPLFMEARGLTASERGDAVHAFLRAATGAEVDAIALRSDLLARGVLSAEQGAALPLAKLSRCLEGPLFVRIRSAGVVRREWPFNLRREENGERTLLQGVIDCCFLEDGQWVLVDYKSDRVSDPSVLVERYRPQIALYASALETITGIPVRERIMFLLDLETGITV